MNRNTHFSQSVAVALALSLSVSTVALAETVAANSEPPTLPDVTVTAPPPPRTASSREIPYKDIQSNATQMDPGDVLRAVPGLLVSQHAGSGKAYEYMLRGFYADHGTDIAFFMDGIPLNMVTHAHGEGYTDLHLLIPETVQGLDVDKGSYQPEQGNYGTAGSVHIKLFDTLPESFLSAMGGSYETIRAAAGVNLPGVFSRSYIAVEEYTTEGPFDNKENYSRTNMLFKGTQDLTSNSQITFLGTHFSSDFYYSGLIPERAVEAKMISPFGSIDPTQGGKTQRQNLAVTYTNQFNDRHSLEVEGYYTRYLLQLYNNFSYFMNNPLQGDGIEQNDNRNMFGGHAQYAYSLPVAAGNWITTVGAEQRNDSTQVDLWNQQSRIRISSVSLSDVWEQLSGIYVKEDIPLSPKLHFMGGLRYDYGHFTANGASANDEILSPKANLSFAATPTVNLFANYGRGHHTNDSRAVVTDSGSGLIRAEGVELGGRARALNDRLTTSLVFWAMDMDSELTFAQDSGGTEASGPSRRAGIESLWTFAITPWLDSNLDLDFSQAKYRDTGGAVELAVNQYIAGGLTAHTESGWLSTLQFRNVGPRWGDTDRTIPLDPYLVFDGLLGYRHGHWGVQLLVENVFNTSWRDGQEVITSQLQGEPAPVTAANFTSGNPRAFFGSAKYYF